MHQKNVLHAWNKITHRVGTLLVMPNLFMLKSGDYWNLIRRLTCFFAKALTKSIKTWLPDLWVQPRTFDHITPILKTLHWLLGHQCIDFEICWKHWKSKINYSQTNQTMHRVPSESIHTLQLLSHPSIHPLGLYPVQSVGGTEAVSWAIGHNPGRVATPTQNTRMAQSSQQAGTNFANLRRMTGWVNPTWYLFNSRVRF